MSAAGSPRPLLVIGLDGATFGVVEPWLASGELRCLSRLYREGLHGRLESVTPPLSPEAWATFMTGKHPGLHGVMNFASFRPGSYQLQFNNGGMIRGKTVWRMVSDAGMRVGVMGMPMTYPPEPLSGYLVSGVETPGIGSRYTHPEGLAQELRAALGGYDLHGAFLDTTDPSEYLSRLLDMVDNQMRAACYLVERYPCDLTALVFEATDRVQHGFWRYLDAGHPWHEPSPPPHLADAIKAVYRRVDDALAQVLERFPESCNILIMSDHGFGPCHTLVDLNGWLLARGHLTLVERRRAGLDTVRKLCSRAAARCPRWLKDLLKARLPGLRSQVASLLALGQVDWARSSAFAISTQYGYIHLNRRDRFPLGIVEPGKEADGLCDRLVAELAELRDPRTGEPVVARVVRTREPYAGPACDSLPDLIVIWRDGYIARMRTDVSLPDRAEGGSGFLRPTGRNIEEWSGSHRADGVLIAHGPDFGAAGPVEGARLMDLAPTILHLLGQPVPEDMTGRVLEELLDQAFVRGSPVRYVKADGTEPREAPAGELSPEESEQVAERLRKLGYL